MTQAVGEGLASGTRIFDLQTTDPKVLDLCMAPGGFTTTAAKYLSGSVIDAITLPSHLGGLEVMATEFCHHIVYADITMYPREMNYEGPIPTGHPDSTNFDLSRPFLGTMYDIVICGGAVGDRHPMESYRDGCERSRLRASELVFALNRLKQGGSIVLLLHLVDSWDTACVIHALSQFSDIQLYKHPRIHAIKSSFYLVAKNIDLKHPAARASISYWQDLWKYLTFRESEDITCPVSSLFGSGDDFVRQLMDTFGPRFLELAQPVWRIQAEALSRAPFTRQAECPSTR